MQQDRPTACVYVAANGYIWADYFFEGAPDAIG